MIEELDTIHGKMFLPDTDIAQFWWLKTIGASAEEEHIELVCALLKERPKGVAIDVGANFGCWALPLAKVAFQVLCFEPQGPIYELLRKTIDANPELRIVAFRYALGSRDGPKTISVPILDINAAANFGGVTLGMAHHEQPDAPMEMMSVCALDNIIYGLGSISFVKIDAEGAEQDILRGAESLIAEDRPILFVEAVHKYTDIDALRAQMESYGYAVDQHGPNFLGMPL